MTNDFYWVLDKYVDWGELFDEEVDIDYSIDWLIEKGDEKTEEELETLNVLKGFQSEECDELCIEKNDCAILPNGFLEFNFGANLGQTEGDSVGYFIHYQFLVDSEFKIIKATYDQG